MPINVSVHAYRVPSACVPGSCVDSGPGVRLPPQEAATLEMLGCGTGDPVCVMDEAYLNFGKAGRAALSPRGHYPALRPYTCIILPTFLAFNYWLGRETS
jgi:hypothetical protein